MIKNIIETIDTNSPETTPIFTAQEDSRIGSLIAEVNIRSALEERHFDVPTLDMTEEEIQTRQFYNEHLLSNIRMELVFRKENTWQTIASYAAINRGAPYRFPLNSMLIDSQGYLWIEKGQSLGIRLVDVSYGNQLRGSDQIRIFGHAIIGREDFTVLRTIEQPQFLGHQWLTTASSNTLLSRNAINGNPDTYWQTLGNGLAGDTFDLNLGVPRAFSRIILEPGQEEADIEVYFSSTGFGWNRILGDWIKGDSYYFPLGNLATQYIRFRLANDLSTPWKISNIQIF